MPNLEKIYAESGVSGILPYATSKEASGYQFLCQKLKEGLPHHFIVFERLITPYYFADEETGEFFLAIYSNKAQAERCVDLMKRDHQDAGVRSSDSWPNPEEEWAHWTNMGFSYILLDDEVNIALSDLTPAPLYDGIPPEGPEQDLRNMRLTSLLYYTAELSYISHNQVPADALAVLWAAMRDAPLLVLSHNTDNFERKTALAGKAGDLLLCKIPEFGTMLPVFTDARMALNYIAEEEIIPEPNQPPLVNAEAVTIGTILELVGSCHATGFLLNPYVGAFPYTRDSVRAMETNFAQQEALWRVESNS